MEYQDGLREFALGYERLLREPPGSEAIGNAAAAWGIVRGLHLEFEQHCREHGCGVAWTTAEMSFAGPVVKQQAAARV
jgi:hypothetical protein